MLSGILKHSKRRVSPENVVHSREEASTLSTSLTDVKQVWSRSSPIPMENESEGVEKQRKLDYKKFCTDVREELDKYVNSPKNENSSGEKTHEFLADIKATSQPPITSKKCAREDSNKKNQFIEILKLGRESSVDGCLNGILSLSFEDYHYEVLDKAVEEKCDGETLLHIALKYEKTHKFAEKYIALRPSVLLKKRKGKSGFEGQTPLHVAIVKGKIMIVKKILETAEKEGIISKLLRTKSKGEEFKDTVLIGELPLSVAALACKNKKFEMMKILLDKNADISKTNSSGDTVFHSLIKYADIYPEKIPYIQASFGFLWGHVCNPVTYYEKNSESNQTEGRLNTKPKNILFMKNNSGLTPLHLSAKLGVSQIFDVIVNTEDVYQFMNRKDGLFDIRVYDVTEFDRLIAYKENSVHELSKKLTILERLFGSRCSHQEAFQMLNQELVLFILKKKWNAYWCPLVVWMIMHFIFMILFTASTIKKAELLLCSQNNETVCEIGEVFYAVIVMDAVFGILYLFFAVLCVIRLIERFKKENNYGFIWHNLDYVLCLLVVSVCVLIESVLITLKIHWDVHVVLALNCGWYFMIYFSPFHITFVSFTYMLQKGFKEDLLPFSVVFLCLFVSFTGIMHILFLGINEEEDGNSFGTILSSFLAMFNLGVGLDNIDGLDKTRIPWLAYTSFVMFAVLSFIHLLNALIAIMSQTFSDVHADKHNYLKYNRLRMIELFEDIVLVQAFIKHIRPSFLEKAKHWRTIEIDEDSLNDNSHNNNEKSNKKNKRKENDNRRFYSEVRLLDDTNHDVDEKDERRKGRKQQFKKIVKGFKRSQRHSQEKAKTQQGSYQRNPLSEITYTQLLNSKASQFPDIEMESKATQFPELNMNSKASQIPEMNSKTSQCPQFPDIEMISKASQFPQFQDIEMNSKASQFP